MKKEFVPFEIAKKLKDLGFNEPCLNYYNIKNDLGYPNETGEYQVLTINEINVNECLAPLYQQVVDWLYNNHKLIVGIETVSLNEWKGFVRMSSMALEDIIEINNTYADIDRRNALTQAINIALNLMKLKTIF